MNILSFGVGLGKYSTYNSAITIMRLRLEPLGVAVSEGPFEPIIYRLAALSILSA